jgi:hypothetical protein
MRKMRAFQEYAQQKKHEARWGIANFRVVSVVPTRERAANLCRKVSESGLAFKRFWFTDFGRYSLDSPADILGKIFTTPRDYRQGVLYSILD